MPSDLFEHLCRIARTPLLLVATDYDGTLAELVLDPALATPDARALKAFRSLAQLPCTSTAIISGRSIRDLLSVLGEDSTDLLIGLHGAEWRRDGVELSIRERSVIGEVTGIIAAITRIGRGVRCEHKPTGVVLHVRGAAKSVADAAIATAIERCSKLPGVIVRRGHEVVELSIKQADKGAALCDLRQALGATGTVFIGDDLTDEDAFAVVTADDLSVRVGEGPTSARYRVGCVSEVATLLEQLVAMRREWVSDRGLVPIERCAILSDQRTLAVVAPGARISWLCLPRLDSAALFAELVGDESAGTFQISPQSGDPPVRFGYDGNSFVLVTEWEGLRVTDYLDCSGGRAYQKAGRADLVRVIEGTCPARVRFAPRLDFGRIATRLLARDEGLVIDGSNDPISLRAPGIAWKLIEEGVHQTAEATVDPSSGPIVLELRYGSANLRPAPQQESQRRDQVQRFWAGWAGSLHLPRIRADAVVRSALVLKALCHGPTGSFAAAATTSLPEQLGGGRNWDYRFCWPRDAALSAAALLRLGNTGHAMSLLDWVLEVVDRCETPDRLHPIYTVTGNHLPPEAELGHLRGYAQSRPVRVGNAAANQVQLDVFGPIVDLVAMLAEKGAPVAPDHWRLVRAMVRAVAARWNEPDHGIWEMRLERRHHVHSKVMCWHTVHRALVVEEAVCGTRNADWKALADSIRDDILTRGWSSGRGAFTGAYGYDYADASVLQIGLTGLLDHRDPRWLATVNFICRELRDGPTVRRYCVNDGLAGVEGGMHICTGWLIESLATIGQLPDAIRLFEHLSDACATLGIMSEQVDPKHGHALGNIAQAYSHLAVINAAVALDAAGATLESPT